MSDPLSVATGVAGLLSLGIQVTESLYMFYTSYKDQDVNIERATGKLENLLDTFRCLDDALRKRTFRPEEQELIKNIQSSVQQCDELIKELQKECAKFQKDSANGLGRVIRVAGRRLAYPFRQSTLQKLDEDIGEIRDNLSLALNALQLGDHRQIQDDIAEVNALLEAMRLSQVSKDIHEWLNPPDATFNHNIACAKRHPGTGMWFIRGDQFSTWLAQNNSFLWINGFAGSGKSVLCSSAIQHTFRQKRHEKGVGIAFFYFTFNDDSKQDASAMLRALLMQLSGQMSDGRKDLERLYKSYYQGTPPTPVLIEHLRHLIKKFHHVFILLDALDECPRYSHREQVLDLLEEMRGWSLPGLHMLVTSRDEPDIRQSLIPVCDQETGMRNAEIDNDISDFISYRLKTDIRLRKWKAHQDRIQEALKLRAQGVFRWVECQFEALKRCPGSLRHLNRCLQSLPQNLDETYERILCSIDKASAEEARRILTLLCFSARPLTVAELIDAIAVDLNEPAGLCYENLLQSEDDMYEICPGLIDIGVETRYGDGFQGQPLPTARIAHFSVQEYLESTRIRQQKVAMFALESSQAHFEIAQVCLVYLQSEDLSSGQPDTPRVEDFPLAEYAAENWFHHYGHCRGMTSQLDDLVWRFFERKEAVRTWLQLNNVDHLRWEISKYTLSDVASPAYYASLLGLDQLLRRLIDENGASSEEPGPIKVQSGNFETAIYAAVHCGHDKIVQMLLDAGVDVNCSSFGAPLSKAVCKGHKKIVQMLLDASADVNGDNGAPLSHAAFRGHEKIMQMLLDAGADVNGNDGAALSNAALGGDEKIVQMLLDAGADVNGNDGAALSNAALGGHGKIVQMLLDTGAVLNGSNFGAPLSKAAFKGHKKIVRMLLDAGADVNGNNGAPLSNAALGGHETIVQMLLDAGADVNGDNDAPFPHAAFRGHETIIQMLFDTSPDVEVSKFSAPLSHAVLQGHERIVQLLLDAGADRCKLFQPRSFLSCARSRSGYSPERG